MTFSNADILFAKKKLIWRLYTSAKAPPITMQFQIIKQKKFMAAILNLGRKTFVIYLTYLKAKMSIHLACEAQLVFLIFEKVTISTEYLDFADIFFEKISCGAL